MVGTKEFYDLMNQFEKDSRELFYGHEVKRDMSNIKGVFYEDGYVNAMFHAYMYGYQSGKLYERFEG